ncbi:MAG: AAA family ATPase [Lachnospiraceae bacterium]|nr:AAA family ATPase [Lachnospiraceae bacterium]
MKNQREWDHLDDAIREWETRYRAHVEEYFWDILKRGLYQCEVKYTDGRLILSEGVYCKSPKLIHVGPMLEELLLPQVLFIGLINEAGHTIIDLLDWDKIILNKTEQITMDEYWSFLLDEEDCCFTKVINVLSDEIKEYIKNYIFSNFEKAISQAETVKDNNSEAKLFFLHIPVESLRKEVFELRKMDSNQFFGIVKNMLEKAKNDHTILAVAEIIETAYREMKTPSAKQQDVNLSDTGYLADLRNRICEKISGQDPAVREFISGLFEGQLSLGKKEGPMCTFLFVGPPGVGKTFLSKVAADALNRPFKVFQMNEYANAQSFENLIGFAKTYKSSMPGTLTSFVRNNPDAVLLFDEIEKAHINTIRQFLSVLEGGFLKDLYYDSEIDFRKTICIFTTNAGRDFYEEKRDMKISSLSEETIIEAMKKDRDEKGDPTMPPEFLSRLAKGHIVGFDHMEPVKLLPIISHGLKEGADYLKGRYNNLTVIYDPVLLSNIFMFKNGSNLDARVASSKSQSFLIDMVYSVMDYETQKSSAINGVSPDWNNISVEINVDLEGTSNETAKKYMKTERKSRFIIIDTRGERAELAPTKYPDAPFLDIDEWYEDDLEGKQNRISNLLKDNVNDIDAILINPFFNNNSENEYEGVLNNKSHGMELLKWLSELDNVPPVYIVIPSYHRELEYNKSDMDSLWALKIRGFIHLDYSELCDLSKDLFLANSLASLSSKGRALGYKQRHKREGNKITVELTDFSEEVSMSPEAVNIFVNDVSEHEGNALDKEVIGADSAKEELKHFIKFLKDPQKYLKSGQSVSKGILLYGPPGTGKTMLAKALAKDADCPFIPVSGAEITIDSIANKDDDKIRDIKGLFRLARKYSPSILFIDEIDAFGKPREESSEINVKIVNNLLTEMDGFNNHKDRPVFVIAATNAADAPDIYGNNIHLDGALLRRFTKKVYVDLPNEDERLKYLQLYKDKLSDKAINMNEIGEEDLNELSRLTAGHSLAEIENAIQIAQGRAAELDDDPILSKELIRDAFEEAVYGEKIENSEEHIKTTAYHEAGHAFMAFQMEERFWPEYATLVGRGNFLGAVSHREDKGHGMTKAQLLGKIRVSLAGRAAEIVFNGAAMGLSTGAGGDLESATWYTKQIICTFGMEDGFLMSISMRRRVAEDSEWDAILKGPMAEKYITKINEILTNELQETIDCITKNKGMVQELGDQLLKRSRLSMEEMKEILHM